MKFRPVPHKRWNWVWEVSCGDRVAILTEGQAVLLGLLCSNPGALVSREEIEAALWGDDENGGPDDTVKSVDAIVARVRERLALALLPVTIATHSGRGFLLSDVGDAPTTRYQSRWLQAHKAALSEASTAATP